MNLRRYFLDDETAKLIVTDDDSEPEGVFVEEISAAEYFRQASLRLLCGWPENVHCNGDKDICPCGFIFPDRAPAHMHDDEALS